MKRRCEFEAEVANRTTAPVGEAAYATKLPCSAANPVDSRTHWYQCHCNSVCPWARASCFAVRASSTSVGEESLLAHPYQLEWCSLHCAAPRANHAHAGKSWCVLQNLASEAWHSGDITPCDHSAAQATSSHTATGNGHARFPLAQNAVRARSACVWSVAITEGGTPHWGVRSKERSSTPLRCWSESIS